MIEQLFAKIFSHIVADLLKLFHNITYSTCLFLGLRKTFYTVSVETLVEKFKMLGILY